MKFYLPQIIFILPLAISSAAYCTEHRKNPCDSVEHSQQILECSIQNKTKADNKLNEEYRTLTKRINSQYQANKTLGTEYISTKKNSQRAWIKLRDTNCALEAFEIETGSQAHTTTINQCIARMSSERTQYLKGIAQETL